MSLVKAIRANHEELQKGFGSKAIATLGLAGALIGNSPTAMESPAHQHDNGYSSQRMLRAISSVESQNGKMTNHKQLPNGERAYGKYGLTPSIVRDTVKMDPQMKMKHSKAINLHGDAMNHYMHDNPGLEDQIAQKHVSRLEHHFGQDPAKIGYAWLNGISGTNKAAKEGKDIQNHWHVQKVKNAYMNSGDK